MADSELFFDSKRYIPARDAARNVGLSANYISKLCKRGLPDARLVEGTWYVNEPALRKFLTNKARNRKRQLEELATTRRRQLLESDHSLNTLWKTHHEAFKKNNVRENDYGSHRGRLSVRPHPLLHMRAQQQIKDVHTLQHVIVGVLSFLFVLSVTLAYELVPSQRNTDLQSIVLTLGYTEHQGAAVASIPFVGPVAGALVNVFCTYIPVCNKDQSLSEYLTSRDPLMIVKQPYATSTTTPSTTTQLKPSQPLVNVVTQPVIERVVETTRVVNEGGISASLLDARLYGLEQKLTSQILALGGSNPSSVTQVFQTASNLARIEHLDELDLTDPTISNATITGGTISSLSSPLAIGSGGTGTSTSPTYGKMLVGNSSGSYDLVATSSLGITSGGSSFDYLFPADATSTPLTFSGGLLSLASTTIGNGTRAGGLTISGGATTTATSTLAGLLVTSGNVGIGTTSPASALTVSGAIRLLNGSNNILFQSNTAASNADPFEIRDQNTGNANMHMGLFAAASGKGVYYIAHNSNDATKRFFFGIDDNGLNRISYEDSDFALFTGSFQGTERFRFTSTGNFGIGTTSPATLLSLAGSSGLFASTTATSTFQGGGINLLTAAGNTGCFAINGTCLPTTNASSTLLTDSSTFTGNNLFLASTTIGAGGQTTGLTISGGATTTGFLTIPVGSSGSPSLRFAGSDQGAGPAGLYFDSSGLLGLVGNGSNILTVGNGSVNNVTTGGVYSINGRTAVDEVTSTALQIGSGYTTLSLDPDAGASQSIQFFGAEDSANIRMTVQAAGNVGIGTTSPYAKLSVVGPVVAEYFHATSTTATTTLQGTVLAASGGNVGVGTTSPWQKLSVSGNIISNFGGNTAQNIFIGDIAPNSGFPGIWFGTAATAPSYSNYSFLSDGSGGALVNAQTGSTIDFRINNNSAFKIDASNNFAVNASALFGFNTAAVTTSNYFLYADTSSTILNTPTSGSIFFRVNHSTKATVDSNGDFGVGTTSPWGVLSITNTGSGPSFVVEDETSPDSTPFIIDASGSVGIGTAAPGAKLTLSAAAGGIDDYISIERGGTDWRIWASDGITGTPSLRIGGDTAAKYAWQFDWSGSTANIFKSPDDNAAQNVLEVKGASSQSGAYLNLSSNSGTGDVLTVLANGRVGIGTTSPWGLLSVEQGTETNSFVVSNTGSSSPSLVVQGVNGNGRVGIGTTSPNRSLHVHDSSYSALHLSTDGSGSALTDGLEIGIDSSFGYIWNYEGPLIFASANTERMRIRGDNGRMGIGTTTPGSLLSVAAGVSIGANYGVAAPTNGLIVEGNVGVATTSPWRTFSVTGTVGLSSSLTALSGTDNGLCIDPSTYEVTNDGGILGSCSSSSMRFKEDVQDITYGLETVMAFRPVSFKWKESERPGDDNRYLGFIAEEMYEVVPEVVGKDSEGQIRSIGYEYLTAVFAKAVQELNLKIEDIATTTASSTPQSDAFASRFFKNLFARMTVWLADAENGIAELFAKKVYAENLYAKELCLSDESGETCVTKQQLDALLNGQTAAATETSGGNTPLASPPPSEPQSEISPPEESSPQEEPTEGEPAPEPQSEPEPEGQAESTVESTPSPAPVEQNTDSTGQAAQAEPEAAPAPISEPTPEPEPAPPVENQEAPIGA